MKIKKILISSIAIALVSLATPFVWMKIGTQGYEYYGPNVPDIYILGATILGKDKSFWGIDFAYKFQLIIILYFILSSFITILRLKSARTVLTLTLINSTLLLLFPVWLYFYTGGVVCNSDCADLTVYPHIGLINYLALIVLNILTINKVKKNIRLQNILMLLL